MRITKKSLKERLRKIVYLEVDKIIDKYADEMLKIAYLKNDGL